MFGLHLMGCNSLCPFAMGETLLASRAVNCDGPHTSERLHYQTNFMVCIQPNPGSPVQKSVTGADAAVAIVLLALVARTSSPIGLVLVDVAECIWAAE
jgi:hypothetical protein